MLLKSVRSRSSKPSTKDLPVINRIASRNHKSRRKSKREPPLNSLINDPSLTQNKSPNQSGSITSSCRETKEDQHFQSRWSQSLKVLFLQELKRKDLPRLVWQSHFKQSHLQMLFVAKMRASTQPTHCKQKLLLQVASTRLPMQIPNKCQLTVWQSLLLPPRLASLHQIQTNKIKTIGSRSRIFAELSTVTSSQYAMAMANGVEKYQPIWRISCRCSSRLNSGLCFRNMRNKWRRNRK